MTLTQPRKLLRILEADTIYRGRRVLITQDGDCLWSGRVGFIRHLYPNGDAVVMVEGVEVQCHTDHLEPY